MRRSKWIEETSPQDRTGDVVDRALKQRLAAVDHYLPLAATRAHENVEYVHQLRVSTRRAMAAMELFAELLPPKRAQWLEKKLKKMRRAAGEARDCDVLAQRMSKNGASEVLERILERIQQRRDEAQCPIRTVHSALESKGRYRRRVDKLLARVADPKPSRAEAANQVFGEWSRRRLRPIVKRFFDSAEEDLSEYEALHRLRIRGKQVRYAMEILVGAFPEAFRGELYPIITKLQDKLGQINDHATAQATLTRWRDAACDQEEIDYLEGLIANEKVELDKAFKAFEQWWTPQRCDDLRRRFEEMIGENPLY